MLNVLKKEIIKNAKPKAGAFYKNNRFFRKRLCFGVVAVLELPLSEFYYPIILLL